jgi:hypothetical protein
VTKWKRNKKHETLLTEHEGFIRQSTEWVLLLGVSEKIYDALIDRLSYCIERLNYRGFSCSEIDLQRANMTDEKRDALDEGLNE